VFSIWLLAEFTGDVPSVPHQSVWELCHLLLVVWVPNWICGVSGLEKNKERGTCCTLNFPFFILVAFF
jgi:hypothetical protein